MTTQKTSHRQLQSDVPVQRTGSVLDEETSPANVGSHRVEQWVCFGDPKTARLPETNGASAEAVKRHEERRHFGPVKQHGAKRPERGGGGERERL